MQCTSMFTMKIVDDLRQFVKFVKFSRFTVYWDIYFHSLVVLSYNIIIIISFYLMSHSCLF